jgi:hypothetical protein
VEETAEEAQAPSTTKAQRHEETRRGPAALFLQEEKPLFFTPLGVFVSSW